MQRNFLCGLAAFAIAAAVLVVAGGDAEAARTAVASWSGHEPALGLLGAGLIVNRANMSNVFRGFQTIFNTAFETAASEHARVAMVVNSTTAEEDYKWLGKTTTFREWIGDRVIQNLAAHSYVLKNRSFENTVGVDRDDIEDDKLGIYTIPMQQLAYDAKTHPDELVFPLLTNGFAQTGYDGQYFFDTDHPVQQADGSTTSVSNMQAGAGPAWFLLDVTKPVKPLIFQKRRDYQFVAMDKADDEQAFSKKLYRYGVDCRVNAGYGLWQLAFGSKAELNEANLAAAIASMRSVKGDAGKPLNVRPSLLVVPPTLEFAANKLLKAEQIGGTTNVLRGTAEVLSTAWIA